MFRAKVWIILGVLFSIFLFFLFYVSHQLKQVKEPLIAFLKSHIQGDIQMKEAEASLFPPGIRLKELRLFAPGDSEPAAFIEEVDLNFKLFPLLFFHVSNHQPHSGVEGEAPVALPLEGETLAPVIDTKIYIRKPKIRMVLGTDGKNNFEKIFEPLLAGQKQKSSGISENLWWKRLSVSKLVIKDARFSSSEARNATPTEIQNLDVEASDIRLESASEPARIKIHFDLPRLSRESVKISLKLQHDPKEEILKLQEGEVRWGAAEMNLGGEVFLPSVQRKNVELNLRFDLDNLDLKKFAKMLVKPLNLAGDVSWHGDISGTAFSPALEMKIDSRTMQVNGKEISKLHSEISKQDKVIEIKKAEMGFWGGLVRATGTMLPEKTISGNFRVDLQSLSLAVITGKPHPARLSGKLDVKGSDIEDARSFSGDGNINLGPIPLPIVNLKDKMKVAEFLTDGSLLAKAINLDFLSSSTNVIGSQIDSLNANISFSGDDIVFNSFRLSNSHFSAIGSGSLQNQKSLKASGTATLSNAVTTLLFPDHNFRSALTSGKGGLSVPFHVSGTVENPDFSIDRAYLKELIAKAAAASLKNMILGNQKPMDFLNSALQGAPLGNLPIPQKAQKNSKPKNFEQFLFGR